VAMLGKVKTCGLFWEGAGHRSSGCRAELIGRFGNLAVVAAGKTRVREEAYLFLSHPIMMSWCIRDPTPRMWTVSGSWGAFGECQVMAQMVARRLLVPPLMNRDFRGGYLTRARGYRASATLHHQKWPRAHILYLCGE
jgi:hypothetical protein